MVQYQDTGDNSLQKTLTLDIEFSSSSVKYIFHLSEENENFRVSEGTCLEFPRASM